ncbi:hypothetical protein E0Y62_15550 [Cytobacillus praedii]|uniref:Uncharacterized protein n=1 Tax=Cytobacillus praedii TaxID=1742358 RepID=A0A4R1B0I7_9BACI|nr:hypothetical protein E0Y62_15550 [Cytobacillus praedii]
MLPNSIRLDSTNYFLLPSIFLLFAAAIISRSLYKLTGDMWLGAMVNTLIITMIGVVNTVTLAILKNLGNGCT